MRADAVAVFCLVGRRRTVQNGGQRVGGERRWHVGCVGDDDLNSVGSRRLKGPNVEATVREIPRACASTHEAVAVKRPSAALPLRQKRGQIVRPGERGPRYWNSLKRPFFNLTAREIVGARAGGSRNATSAVSTGARVLLFDTGRA